MSKRLVALALTAFGCRTQVNASGTGDAAATDAYVAPQPAVTRHAIAVIADFSDARLEDWAGRGIRSEHDLRQIVDSMTAHWAFLSHGLEQMQWDIVRVQLPQRAEPTAFADASAFRDAVVDLAKQHIATTAYDLQGDGVIDTLWIVPASNGRALPYLTGGTAVNAGALTFVDVQDADSFVKGSYGDFTREVGHTLGLVDTAGTFGTLADLDLMASSAAVPGNDFTAFERTRLGWLAPRVITHSSTGLVLHDATKQLDAILVTTARPEEYFLLEYRKRPSSGFGSALGFAADGIAVLHVFEASSQNVDPPLLRLVPADGALAAGAAPEPKDLAFADNPTAPLVMRTYFGGDAVFSIANVRSLPGDAIAFDLTMLSDGPGTSRDLMTNGTFETGTDGWSTGGFGPEDAMVTWAARGANGSQHSLSIATTAPGELEWSASFAGLPWNTAYYVCGWLAGDHIAGGPGATLSIPGTAGRTSELHGTFDFTRRCTVAPVTAPSFRVACGLGGTGSPSTGQVWCDDISLYLLSSAF